MDINDLDAEELTVFIGQRLAARGGQIDRPCPECGMTDWISEKWKVPFTDTAGSGVDLQLVMTCVACGYARVFRPWALMDS